MTTPHPTSIYTKGEKLSSDYFTGNAFLNTLLTRDKNNNFAMGSVTFEPKARTHWHTHPKGQILIVIEGEGLYQEKGKPARPIRKGDVISIPEKLEHWHGASSNNKMIHIAITNFEGEQNVIWLDPVSEEDYNAANKK